MWGCLQGIRGAREILAKGISAHPVVANGLNVHMQKRSIMREEHNKIQSATEKLITSLPDEVRKQALDVRRLSTEVTKLRAKKP